MAHGPHRTVCEPSLDRITADLLELAAITETGREGWTRTALSDANAEGRQWVLRRMREAGLHARIDAVGNVVGRLPGRSGTGGALVTGSHTDTVEGGGRFDGTVGLVGALEAVRCLRQSDVRLAHDLLVIDFFGEEPNPFGTSCLGSRALAGRLRPEHLALTDDHGVRLADALLAAGLDIERLDSLALAPRDLHAFLELHIEQGPVLEQQDTQIGLVHAITGVARFRALFRGRADHAGTTSMKSRHDAGCAAAGTVLAVERIASAHEDGRGTVGSVTFTPDAVNVVSAYADVRGELRSPHREWLSQAQQRLLEAAGTEAASRGVRLDLEWLTGEHPVPMSGDLTGLCEATVAELGYRQARLYSGAEHDAAQMASLGPSAMLFVPSRDGRSHCPQEWTDAQDIRAGVHALTQCLVAADSEPASAAVS